MNDISHDHPRLPRCSFGQTLTEAKVSVRIPPATKLSRHPAANGAQVSVPDIQPLTVAQVSVRIPPATKLSRHPAAHRGTGERSNNCHFRVPTP